MSRKAHQECQYDLGRGLSHRLFVGGKLRDKRLEIIIKFAAKNPFLLNGQSRDRLSQKSVGNEVDGLFRRRMAAICKEQGNSWRQLMALF